MSLKQLARLVLFNLGVLLVLWMGLLFATAAISDVVRAVKAFSSAAPDKRGAFPNYTDHAYAARIYSDTRRRGDENEYRPFIEWRRRPFSSETVNVDANGLRTHAAGRANNDASATSLGFFGGSAMWGVGADDNGTIPAI